MENKKFIKDNIKLMNFWDSEKNSIMGYNPSSITCGTHSKFWCKCSMCGDSFMQRPNDLLHSNLNVCKIVQIK